MESSLYERLGGEAAIMSAVDLFYEKVLQDPLLASFFQSMDMRTQGRKLVGFMAWAFGGPDSYKGRDLAAAHAPLLQRGLGDAHFDEIAQHLQATLRELGISEPLQAEVIQCIAATRGQVLGRQ